MKKIIIICCAAIFMIPMVSLCQTKVVGTIVDVGGGNRARIYGKPNATLTNVQFRNITITVSILDQGASNPTNAQITQTVYVPNLDVVPGVGNPWINGGRAYYFFNMSDLNNGLTSTWNSGTHNSILELAFPTLTTAAFQSMRLYDVGNPPGGGNGLMNWYVEVIGPGDITDYTNLFYGTAGLPPTISTNSFVPLEPASLVPVKFLGFTAIKVNNDAQLNWQVGNEDAQTDRYEVERSTNGSGFVTVATVPKKTNGLSNNSYDLIDANINTLVTNNTGVIYYRVKQYDRSGQFVYSEIRNIRMSGFKGFGVTVFPNPIKDIATVNIDLASAGTVYIYLTDVAGKEIQKVSLEGAAGGNTKKVDMSKLASGAYLFKVQSGSDIRTVPVVKAN